MRLTGNRLKALTQEEDLNSLQILNLDSQGISEAEGLNECKNLASLSLRFNYLSHLNFTDYLSQLWILDLQQNQIRTFEGLKTIPILGYLRISVNPSNTSTLGYLHNNMIIHLNVIGNITKQQILHLMPLTWAVGTHYYTITDRFKAFTPKYNELYQFPGFIPKESILSMTNNKRAHSILSTFYTPKYYCLQKESLEGDNLNQLIQFETEKLEKFPQDLDYCCELDWQLNQQFLNLNKFKFPIFQLSRWKKLPISGQLTLCTFLSLYLEGLIWAAPFKEVFQHLMKDIYKENIPQVECHVLIKLEPHLLLGLLCILIDNIKSSELNNYESDFQLNISKMSTCLRANIKYIILQWDNKEYTINSRPSPLGKQKAFTSLRGIGVELVEELTRRGGILNEEEHESNIKILCNIGASIMKLYNLWVKYSTGNNYLLIKGLLLSLGMIKQVHQSPKGAFPVAIPEHKNITPKGSNTYERLGIDSKVPKELTDDPNLPSLTEAILESQTETHSLGQTRVLPKQELAKIIAKSKARAPAAPERVKAMKKSKSHQILHIYGDSKGIAVQGAGERRKSKEGRNAFNIRIPLNKGFSPATNPNVTPFNGSKEGIAPESLENIKNTFSVSGEMKQLSSRGKDGFRSPLPPVPEKFNKKNRAIVNLDKSRKREELGERKREGTANTKSSLGSSIWGSPSHHNHPTGFRMGSTKGFQQNLQHVNLARTRQIKTSQSQRYMYRCKSIEIFSNEGSTTPDFLMLSKNNLNKKTDSSQHPNICWTSMDERPEAIIIRKAEMESKSTEGGRSMTRTTTRGGLKKFPLGMITDSDWTEGMNMTEYPWQEIGVTKPRSSVGDLPHTGDKSPGESNKTHPLTPLTNLKLQQELSLSHPVYMTGDEMKVALLPIEEGEQKGEEYEEGRSELGGTEYPLFKDNVFLTSTGTGGQKKRQQIPQEVQPIRVITPTSKKQVVYSKTVPQTREGWPMIEYKGGEDREDIGGTQNMQLIKNYASGIFGETRTKLPYDLRKACNIWREVPRKPTFIISEPTHIVDTLINRPTFFDRHYDFFEKRETDILEVREDKTIKDPSTKSNNTNKTKPAMQIEQRSFNQNIKQRAYTLDPVSDEKHFQPENKSSQIWDQQQFAY